MAMCLWAVMCNDLQETRNSWNLCDALKNKALSHFLASDGCMRKLNLVEAAAQVLTIVASWDPQ